MISTTLNGETNKAAKKVITPFCRLVLFVVTQNTHLCALTTHNRHQPPTAPAITDRGSRESTNDPTRADGADGRQPRAPRPHLILYDHGTPPRSRRTPPRRCSFASNNLQRPGDGDTEGDALATRARAYKRLVLLVRTTF